MSPDPLLAGGVWARDYVTPDPFLVRGLGLGMRLKYCTHALLSTFHLVNIKRSFTCSPCVITECSEVERELVIVTYAVGGMTYF